MTKMVEPRGRAGAVDDHELASLVTRWVGARGDGAASAATDDVVDETALVGETAPGGVGEPAEPALERMPRRRALPHRAGVVEAQQATRRAVLIDARRTSEDHAAALLAWLGGRGSVDVCRAYADWSRSDLSAWAGRLRPQGLSSFHQFAADGDQALVAMALDAVDIAREAAVDEVVVVGDMTSMLPMVHRLHAAGVRVVVVGPAHTAHDVRAACDEFIDADSLTGERAVALGRHRA